MYLLGVCMMSNVEFRQIANMAIKDAIAENTRLGLPNVFVINGKKVYQLPNGDFVDKIDWSAYKSYTKEEVDRINKEFENKNKKC